MADPYRIEGPAQISFSGGRTSGMMLKKVIDAHRGSLPDDVFVTFANTGKENEATLRFVHECSIYWDIKIHWLEFVTDLKSAGPAGRFEEVGYNSASRNGEPLTRLIDRKKALFSTITGRWCTERCKVGVMHDFMEAQGYPRGAYTEVIGFRADEHDRVFEFPRKPRNVDRKLRFPLADDGVRKVDVFAFWAVQPFDLMIERGTGNCDHCPFLQFKARVIRARRDPEGCGWWMAHEAVKKFNFGYESFDEVLKAAKSQPLLQLDDTEADASDSECGAWCEAA
jgi:3'-phosphoadenosine 5'-phosphosulfate sulfotransferase (PAPS reductase)/FAD synthetase